MPPSDPVAFVDVQHYVRAARIAERGTFDAVFLAEPFSARWSGETYSAARASVASAKR